MGHSDEGGIQDAVAGRLAEEYGNENVRQEVYLPETGRYADIVVDARARGHSAEPDRWVIEIEDDAEGAIESVGQVSLYAAELGAEPVIMVPPDHFEQPEVQYLQETVRFEEIPGY